MLEQNRYHIVGMMLCRPDAHRSRPFGSLSGGQQALATLALSFALQAAFPSPFYFFDEIDSALDTSNASRVADYIASQKDAQYLVVSHKPQVCFSPCHSCGSVCLCHAQHGAILPANFSCSLLHDVSKVMVCRAETVQCNSDQSFCGVSRCMREHHAWSECTPTTAALQLLLCTCHRVQGVMMLTQTEEQCSIS